jgi:hypothetical protein
MYICHSSYKLGEDLLNSRDRKSSMVEEIVVELVTLGQIGLAMRHFAGDSCVRTWTVFQCQPNITLSHNDLV